MLPDTQHPLGCAHPVFPSRAKAGLQAYLPSRSHRLLTMQLNALMWVAVQVKQQLRKMKEKAISRGKWQGSGGPKGAAVISELVDWEV